MAFNKAFTGGAWAPGGEGQSMGNNAFTNAMDFMISGGANAAQKAEGFGPQMDSANMAQMDAFYKEQENLEKMDKQFENMNINPPQMMHPAPAPQAEVSQSNLEQMNNFWDTPMQKSKEPQVNNMNMGMSQMPHHSQGVFGVPGMMNPGMMNPMMRPPMMNSQPMMQQQNLAKEEVKVEEMPEVVKEDKQMYQDELKESTAQIIKMLNQVPSEKVQNSEFLGFMKQLNTGALEINDNGVETNSEKMKEFNEREANLKKMDAEWYKKNLDAVIEETKDPEFYREEGAMKEKDPLQDFDPTNIFRDAWDAGEMSEDQLQTMMNNWKTAAEKSMNHYSENLVEPPVETEIKVEKVDHFKFEEENPYFGVDDAYELAWRLNEELKVHDAILALKAHLTKEPDHAPSWRMLGQLYQENDEDDKAIAYLLKAYDLDPYDWDSLLYLGVSCTNELNPRVAMGHLLDWLKYNPEYCDLPIPQEHIEDIDILRGELKNLFHQALNKNPDDVDVLVCLGVVEFGERNYQDAADYFGKAAHQNPTDYNLWNKYGAALANHLRTDEALQLYDKTLALRPNLVRTWANVGVAYWNQDRYEEAAGKFMNAIALNPNAEHLWKHLHACFWALKQFDKCEMVKKRNIELFRGEYDIINPDMLTKE